MVFLPPSYATALLAVLIPVFIVLRRFNAADPYGLFHLELNREDGDPEICTEWLNMGFWRDTLSFPKAAEALAAKTISGVEENCRGKVLDVGYGTGESILQLLRLPRPPFSIVGITSIPSHHHRSLRRVRELQEASPEFQTTRVSLHAGDAVLRESSEPSHPFRSDSEKYNLIRALDCAYHFQTRNRFLSQAFERLEPNGQVVLADLCFDEERKQWLRWLVRLMPAANAITKEQYVSDMKYIGFREVKLEDISDDVFPGFVRFLRGKGVGWVIFAELLRWSYSYLGLRFVLVVGGI